MYLLKDINFLDEFKKKLFEHNVHNSNQQVTL